MSLFPLLESLIMDDHFADLTSIWLWFRTGGPLLGGAIVLGLNQYVWWYGIERTSLTIPLVPGMPTARERLDTVCSSEVTLNKLSERLSSNYLHQKRILSLSRFNVSRFLWLCSYHHLRRSSARTEARSRLLFRAHGVLKWSSSGRFAREKRYGTFKL